MATVLFRFFRASELIAGRLAVRAPRAPRGPPTPQAPPGGARRLRGRGRRTAAPATPSAPSGPQRAPSSACASGCVWRTEKQMARPRPRGVGGDRATSAPRAPIATRGLWRACYPIRLTGSARGQYVARAADATGAPNRHLRPSVRTEPRGGAKTATKKKETKKKNTGKPQAARKKKQRGCG